MGKKTIDRDAFALAMANGESNVRSIEIAGSTSKNIKEKERAARRLLKEDGVKELMYRHSLDINHKASAHLLVIGEKAVRIMEEALCSEDIPLKDRAKLALDIRKGCSDILPKKVEHTHTHEGLDLDDLINQAINSGAINVIEGELVEESRDDEESRESSTESEEQLSLDVQAL